MDAPKTPAAKAYRAPLPCIISCTCHCMHLTHACPGPNSSCCRAALLPASCPWSCCQLLSPFKELRGFQRTSAVPLHALARRKARGANRWPCPAELRVAAGGFGKLHLNGRCSMHQVEKAHTQKIQGASNLYPAVCFDYF